MKCARIMMMMTAQKKKNVKWIGLYFIRRPLALAPNATFCSTIFNAIVVDLCYIEDGMCVLQKNHFQNWKYYSITAREVKVTVNL